MSVDHRHWSRIAAESLAWTRTPNHDAFSAYRASLVAFIGQGQGEALDVGCGERRVPRVLKDCGRRVTAIDPVEAFVSAAEQAGSVDEYRMTTAANLPFADETFDLAIAYDLYSDPCRLTNQSETQYPLTLQRVELGSLGEFARNQATKAPLSRVPSVRPKTA